MGIVLVASLILLSRNRIPGRGGWPQSIAARASAAAAAMHPMTVVQPRSPRADLATIEALRSDSARLGALGIAARGETDELLCELRSRLGPHNAGEVVRALPREELATPFGLTAIEAWLQADVGAASTWVAGQQARTDSHAWLLAHALTQHPDLLNRFCDRLGSDAWAETFLDYAAREMLRTNPFAAASIAESLQPGERRTALVETIAFDWMDRDPVAARAWITASHDRSLREHLVSIGAQSYAAADPLNALEWLLENSEGHLVPPQALRSILETWRSISPAQATAFEVLLSPAGTADSLSNVR